MGSSDSREIETSSGRILGTAINALKALDLIAANPRGVSAKVLAHRLEVSLSTAYGLINSLRSEGFVEVSPTGSGLFTLSEKIPRLYQGYVEASTQPERFEPFLDELRSRARARAYAGLWKNGDLEVVQILGRRGARELHDVSKGFRGGAHALALGKLYLATLGERQWPSYLRRPILKRFSRKTITSRLELQAHVRVVGERGLAFDIEEYEEGSCCAAVPVLDGSGAMIATLGVSVSAQRFRWDRHKLVTALHDVAHEASMELALRQGVSERSLSTPRPEAVTPARQPPEIGGGRLSTDQGHISNGVPH